MKSMTFYEELQWRGLVNQTTSPELAEKLNAGGMNFYIGTDPTADSLHLGHYSSFLITKRMQRAGHHPLVLVGMATGLIGDPRGTVERDLKQREEVVHNYESLKTQVERLFGFETVSNHDWIGNLNVVDFFREYGKYINIGYMLTKDHVRRQMESGISYAEFSYMLIQAIDFKHLHETRGVDLQVAGSDQWGNITTGIELIRKTTGDEVYGFTMPLLLDSRGNKFGKSEGNALWLDREKTSPYALYQYLLNTDDASVVSYLKRLTFFTPEEIMEIEARHGEDPGRRIAQKALAREVVSDIHGADECARAVETGERLFAGDYKNIEPRDIAESLKDAPRAAVSPGTLLEVLMEAGVCRSKREAREHIANGAISVNGETVKDPGFMVDSSRTLDGRNLVVRRGKKRHYLCSLK